MHLGALKNIWISPQKFIAGNAEIIIVKIFHDFFLAFRQRKCGSIDFNISQSNIGIIFRAAGCIGLYLRI